ncbi:hypothetical protein [Bradyrhizobium sp. 8-10B]|uniref:hypothetical protein n=1 Tax=Bradyrhizobium sp. 8-10B TaxID=3344579 RepID=UPI0035C16837
MNKQLRIADIGPYRPIREDVQLRGISARSHVRLATGDSRIAPEVAAEISAAFDAKENLRSVRSSILDPNAVHAGSLRLAEAALLRQSGASDPKRVEVSIDSLALDLSKILD